MSFYSERKIYFIQWVLIGLIALYSYLFVEKSADFGVGLAIVLMFFCLISIYFYGGFIEVGRNVIIFKKLFFFEKEIQFENIYSWEIEIGIFRYIDRFKPTARLEIYSKDKKCNLIIPIKMFEKKDVDDLVGILNKISISKKW